MGSIGYARVSTTDQNSDLQHVALKAAGCHRIFTDHGVSGSRASRPELNKMLKHLPGEGIPLPDASYSESGWRDPVATAVPAIRS